MTQIVLFLWVIQLRKVGEFWIKTFLLTILLLIEELVVKLHLKCLLDLSLMLLI